MQLNRRQLLGAGLGGALLLSAGLALRGTRLAEPAAPLQALSPREFSVLVALADVICPASGEFPAASALQVAEKVDALLATCHPGLAMELGQAMLLVENALAGLVLTGNPRSFSHSPPEVQAAAWQDWASSSIPLRRSIYKGLNGLVTATYWADRGHWARVGYPGPPHGA